MPLIKGGVNSKEKVMKKFSVSTLILVVSISVLGQQQPTPGAPANLAAVMKAMSNSLKKIAVQVNDPSKNADSEKLAEDLVAMTKNSKDHFPKKASDPDKQQHYLKLIDDTIVLAQELSSAFHDNNNAKAIDVLNKLSAGKKEGHAAFK
jgi:hypothetical protein